MSNRDQFPKLKNGLYINGILVELLNGYYFDNTNIGIPDGCYSDGAPLSQVGSASFTMNTLFSAEGTLVTPKQYGSASFTMNTVFSAYGTATTPASAYAQTLEVKIEPGIDIQPKDPFGQGFGISSAIELRISIKHKA